MKASSSLYMLTSAVLFGVMGLFIKLASLTIPIFEVTFFRSFLAWLITAGFMHWRGIPATGHNQVMLLIRSVSGCAAMVCYFYAISAIPLANAALLAYSSPLFITILAALIFKEAFNRRIGLALFSSLTGVYLVLKPELHLQWGAVVALLSALFAAIAMITIKLLSESDTPWVVVYHFTLISSLVTAPLLFRDFVIPDPRGALDLLGVALTGAAGQIFMTAAYQRGEASTGSIISLTTVAIIAGLGYLVLGEVLDGRALIGGLVIMGSSVYLAWQGKGVRPAT